MTNWIFLLAGQSNAVGSGAELGSPTDLSYEDNYAACRYAYQNACYSEDAPEQVCNAEQPWGDLRVKPSGFGPAAAIGRALDVAMGDANNHVWLIESATGGSDLYEDWDPTPTSGRYHYTKMKRFWDAQIAGMEDVRFGGTIWIQGERDAQVEEGGTNYEANLIALKAAIDADLGVGPFVAARLSSAAVAWTYKGDVNAAFDAVAAADASVYAVNTDAIELQSDATHYTADGLIELGEAMAAQAAIYWGGLGGGPTFAAFDADGVPLAGLTPTWVIATDLISGPIVPPTLTEFGGGLYQVSDALTATCAGIIDLGATASPRYVHVDALTRYTLAAYGEDLGPLDSLAPVWASYVDANGVAAEAPAISEVGSGLYEIEFAGGDLESGVIDLGATATPRYVAWESPSIKAPVIANMTPAPGTIVAGTPVEFDVTDVAPGLLKVLITLKYASRAETILVHDGTKFCAPFNAGTSSRAAIANGYHYIVKPAAGWVGTFKLDVIAIDASGNIV